MMNIVKKIIFVAIISSCYTLQAQETCDFKKFENRIDMLIKEHEASSDDKQFVPIGNFTINSQQGLITNTLSGTRPFIFVFAPGRTFRFYVVSQEADARVSLLQHADGLLKRKESLILFEAIHKGNQTTVGYYDYHLAQENEFQLLFRPENTKKGCALMKFVEIAPLKQ
jgi:hypothetical protein